MAKEYTVKVFGKKTKYRKVNGKFFRVKKDGTLAKDAATGLVLANLKNAVGSKLVSGPGKVIDIVKSAAKESLRKKTGSGQMSRGTKQAIASPTKKENGKAVADFARDIKKATKKTVTKTVNKNGQSKTDKKVELPKKRPFKTKEKITKPLQSTRKIDVKTTKTKALQNQPKNGNGNGSKTKARKPESRLDAKGNYKGTNIKPTKLQLERLKRRGLA
tara:strand:- start:156 stop:806 length:651 start_codon:yes stop_codon:yes gene_type:complete